MRQLRVNINQSLSNKTESIIYLLIWILVFAGPLIDMEGSYSEINWTRIYVNWIRLIPYLLIFLINTTILAPYFLLKNRLLFYLLLVSWLVLLVVILSPNLRELSRWIIENSNGSMSARRFTRVRSSLFGQKTFIAILVIGMNNTIKLLIQRQKENKRHAEQKKLLLQTELSFLRNQISPHFFMNTLNNIHALIAIDPDKAGESVIQLSELMRHMLSEGEKKKAPIKVEFDFLNAYISLMKLRCSQRIKIDVDLNIQNNNRLIPSLLFVSLVENAFKYGVDYAKPSFISIKANVEDDVLIFRTCNSNNSENQTIQKTGVGLVNLRQQLDLLYKTDYSLTISDEKDQFSVQLKIPLDYD